MNKHLSIVLSATACTALLLAGCGGEQSNRESSGASAQTQNQAQADADALTVMQGDGDALEFDSVTDLAATVPVALTGTIDDIAPGLTVVQSTGSDELEVHWEHAVVRVRVDQVYKSKGVDLDSKFAYVLVPLGGQATDLSGKVLGDGPSTVKPIGELQKGLPSGTRVVVAADVLPNAGAETRYLNATAGAEPGAPLLRGNSPMTFSVEDGATRQLSGWDSTTYDEAVAGLQKAFG